MSFKVLQLVNTSYCADSTEWCPIQPYLNYFVCGTYELVDSTKKDLQKSTPRIGQLHLLSISENLEIQCHFLADSSGILDIKWRSKKFDDRVLLATSNSDGTVILWEFKGGDTSSLVCLTKFQLNNEDILSLSLDWSETDDLKLCVSDSKGFLNILCLNSNYEWMVMDKFKVCDYEAWITTFNIWNNSVLFTGGDDCLLKVIDLRTQSKIVTRQNEHSGGVTSIRFNHSKENLVASGSYDETIKLWDHRNLKTSLSSFTVGGGIWRIKWDPLDASKILTAAMYSGVYLLQYSTKNHKLQELDDFKYHEGIAYGADYCRISPSEIKERYKDGNCLGLVTATCSFYDKLICVCVL